jgi:hypothetical protein
MLVIKLVCYYTSIACRKGGLYLLYALISNLIKICIFLEIKYLYKVLIALAYKVCVKGFALKEKAIYANLYNLYIKYIFGSYIRLAVYPSLLEV